LKDRIPPPSGDHARNLPARKFNPMIRLLLSLFLLMSSSGLVATDAQAKRLGGGTTSGMKRQAPPPQPAQPVPAQPAAIPGGAVAAPPPTMAPPPRRSWLGPIAGIAAGIGLAALVSHLGWGDGFGDIIVLALMAGMVWFAVRALMRRFAPAGGAASPMVARAGFAEPAFGGPGAMPARRDPAFGGGFGGPAAAMPVAADGLPPGFDKPGFEHFAERLFIRLQAANDAGMIDELRQHATPEMAETFQREIQSRQGPLQQTDVMQIRTQLLAVEREAGDLIASVRFQGQVREDRTAALSTPFDETWHLIRPVDGSRDWLLAGIAQGG
jgi:predicted lipid-binding transport protein (Tim44 family)